MTEADLPAVEAWLRLPHVARWWTPGTAPRGGNRQVPGADPPGKQSGHAHADGHAGQRARRLVPVVPVGRPPRRRRSHRRTRREIGIDYTIGDPAQIGKGAGAALIAALTAEIRRPHPRAGILADPDAANTASRRVLEKNGFRLVAVKPVTTEATDASMAIYRLPPPR